MKRTMMIVLLAVAAATAACGSDDEPLTAGDEPGGGGDGARTIQDPGEYRSVEVTEDGQPKSLVEGTTINLRFTDGSLSARAGCNTIGGPYSIDDGVLVVESLSMTEMGCDPELMDQDTWLVEVLSAGPTMESAEDGFVLSTERTTIRFVDREVVEPDADLVGTTWTEAGFIDGDTAMSMAPPREGRRGTLRFEENGFVTGFDGCNDFGYAESADPDTDPSDLGLTYDVNGDQISIEGSAVQTQVACEGDYAERFMAVLHGTVTWEIDGSTLTLTAPDGRGVVFSSDG